MASWAALEIQIGRGQESVQSIQRDALLFSSPLGSAALASMVDEHAAHRPRGDGKEVRSALPIDSRSVRQTLVELTRFRGFPITWGGLDPVP